jgi:transcription elongation factor Elf1
MECQYCDSRYKKLIGMDQDEGVYSCGIRGKPWTTEEERDMKDKITKVGHYPCCPHCMISAWWNVRLPKCGEEIVAKCPVCEQNFFVERFKDYTLTYKKISREAQNADT